MVQECWKIIEKYVPVERAMMVVNGCGPQGLGALVPDLGNSELCNLHDVLYSLGYGKSEKVVVDLWFINHLKASDTIPGFIVKSVAKVLAGTNFNRRPLGVFSQMDKSELALLRYELLNQMFADIRFCALESARLVA